MASVNKIILVGNLGADPELRHTASGRAVSNLSVATNFTYLDQEQNRQERVSWHKVVAWGRLAEICKEHLTKGRQIYVEGRLEHRSYIDREGNRRTAAEVVATSIQFIGRSEGEPSADAALALTSSEREPQGGPPLEVSEPLPF